MRNWDISIVGRGSTQYRVLARAYDECRTKSNQYTEVDISNHDAVDVRIDSTRMPPTSPLPLSSHFLLFFPHPLLRHNRTLDLMLT